MKRKKILGFVLASVLLLSLFAGCGNTTGTAPSDAAAESSGGKDAVIDAGGTVVLADESEEKAEKLTDAGTVVVGVYSYTMANLRCSQSRNYAVIAQVFDPLFYEDRTGETWETKNLLCDSYEYYQADDGQWILHITIVQSATFASGEEITAEDVLWSIEDMLGGSWATAVNTIDFEQSYTEGAYDVYFVLPTYDPNIVESLATPNSGISNKSWAETAAEDDWWDKVDESGPFELVEMVNGAYALMKVRDDYWGWGTIDERPVYDYMKVVFYSEASTMVIDFENGDLDMACSLAKSAVERIQDAGGMEHAVLYLIPTGTLMSLVFNQSTKVLQDYNVRKAIALVVDVEAITAAVAGPLGEPSTGYISPGPAGDYYIDFGVNEYDPAKARELLEEAGYADGDINLKMVIKITDADQNFATILQASLAEIGINLTVEEYEMSTAIAKFREGGTDILFNLFTSGLYPAAVYTNRQSDTSLLTVKIIDDAVQEKLAIGNTAETFETAYEAYAYIQNYQHENCTEVPIYEQISAVLAKDYIDASHSYTYRLSGITDLRFVDLIG